MQHAEELEGGKKPKLKKTNKRVQVFVTIEDALNEVHRVIKHRENVTGEKDCLFLCADGQEILVAKSLNLLVKRVNNAQVFQPYEKIEEEWHTVIFCLTVLAEKNVQSSLRRKLTAMRGVRFFPIRKLSEIELALSAKK